MSIKDQEINDIIKLSTSPYNAPLLVVPKKGTNGAKQHLLVVDFRKLNTKIVKFSSKNETIPKYPIPKNADEIRRFVAFCNYYERFIPNFAERAKPHNSLLKKNMVFEWNAECQKSLETMRDKLIQAPIL